MMATFGHVRDHITARPAGCADGRVVLSTMGRGDSPIYCATPAVKFVLDGEERYEVDGRVRVVRPGEFLLVEAGTQLRAILPRRDCTVGLCIYLRQDEWAPYVTLAESDENVGEPPDGRVIVLSASGTALGRHLDATAKRLAANPSCSDPAADAVCRVTSHHLHGGLVDIRRGIAAIDAAGGVTRRDLYSRLDRARAFLHDTSHRPVPLTELAKLAGLSQFHLLRSYAAVFGEPPATYHRRLRLDRAAADLVGGGMSAASIGQVYGFGDPRSFRRAFVRRFGISPKQYERGKPGD